MRGKILSESRETVVGKITGDQNRLQYDDKDSDRLEAAVGELTEAAVNFIGSVGEYDQETKTPVDDTSATRMRAARQKVVETYATLQVALNRIGYVFRIDGDEAFSKMVDFISGPEDATLVLSGL
jgi:phospholipase/lecithinase/hemolysin